MSVSVQLIEKTLAGTQCRACGFEGCTPYAEALHNNAAELNLCKPGGAEVIAELAELLGKPPLPPAEQRPQPELAAIDLATCVGCTVCMKVCPTGAIVGASKMVHSVIAEDCTGCGLCVDPCPVDCITLAPNAKVVEQQNKAVSLAAWVQARRAESQQLVTQKQAWKDARKLGEDKPVERFITPEQQAKIAAAREKLRHKYGADK